MLKRILSQEPTPKIWVLVSSGLEAHLYWVQENLIERPSSWTRRHPLVTQDSHLSLVPIPDFAYKIKPLDVYEDPSLGRTTVPHEKLQTLVEDETAKELAERLEKAAAQSSFDQLILVMPARFMSRLKKKLARSVQEKVLAEVPKNLLCSGHLNEKSVLEHIEEAASSGVAL